MSRVDLSQLLALKGKLLYCGDGVFSNHIDIVLKNYGIKFEKGGQQLQPEHPQLQRLLIETALRLQRQNYGGGWLFLRVTYKGC